MSVINCKVAHIRPKYKNLKEWVSDEKNVYIGRAGIVFIDKCRFPTQSSNFANPYKIGKDGSRTDAINKYKKYITEKLESDLSLQKELLSLKGKNLGCWCAPEACHGDVLLEMIDYYSAARAK